MRLPFKFLGAQTDRDSKLYVGFSMTFLARASGFGVDLAIMSLIFRFLGAESYGVWAAVLTLTVVSAFSDFGIGNSVINRIAQLDGSSQQRLIGRTIVNAIQLTTYISLCGLVVIILASVLFVATIGEIDTVALGIIAFAIYSLIMIPLNIIQKVQIGLQRTDVESGFQMLSRMLSLAFVILGIVFTFDVLGLILCYFMGDITSRIINWGIFFYRREYELRSSSETREFRKLMNSSKYFFCAQILNASWFGFDNVTMIYVYGEEIVAQYASVQRMLSVVPVLAMSLSTPLWPALRNAFISNDIGWLVTRVIGSSVLIVSFGLIFTIVFWVYSDGLIRFVSDGAISVDSALLIAQSLFTILFSVFNVVLVLSGAIGLLRLQVMLLFCGLLFLALGKYIVVTLDFGVIYIPILNSVAVLLFYTIPFCVYFFRWLIKKDVGSLLKEF